MTTESQPISERTAMTVAEENTEVVSIFINKIECRMKAGEVTGRDLRQAPETPIAPDRDLWRECPGDGPDEQVEDEQIVVIEEGARFFTAARYITPG